MNNHLFKLYTENRLPHFCILRHKGTDSHSQHGLWESFVDHFSSNVLKHHAQASAHHQALNGHSDWLIVRPQSSDKNYVQEDFEEFFSFMELRPAYLPAKFIILPCGELMTENLFNKLLLSLERPAFQTYIFLFVSEGHRLLPTVQSRGVQFFLNLNLHHEQRALCEFKFLEESDQKFSLTEILEQIAKKPEQQKSLFRLIKKWAINCDEMNYEDLSSWQQMFQNFEEQKVFHPGLKHQWAPVIYSLFSDESKAKLFLAFAHQQNG